MGRVQVGRVHPSAALWGFVACVALLLLTWGKAHECRNKVFRNGVSISVGDWVVFRGRDRRRLCAEGCGLAAFGFGIHIVWQGGKGCAMRNVIEGSTNVTAPWPSWEANLEERVHA